MDARDTGSPLLSLPSPYISYVALLVLYEKASFGTLKRNDVCVRRGNEGGRYMGRIRGVMSKE